MNNIIEMFNKDETKFAKTAVLEAKKNKGKINDYLLEHITEILKEYKDKEYPMSVVYSIYLLAEFEEERLFPILIKIFKNELNETIEEFILDRLNSILVSVFNGDFETINAIIENKKIDEFVRVLPKV